MNWLRKFMLGRYGGDQLSIYLLVLSMVLTLIGKFVGIAALSTVGYIPLLAAGYRTLSKDIRKRSKENYKFTIFISPIYSRLKKVQSRIKGSKTHKYYKCSKCKTMLRVPKGKGKIKITCPKCKDKFIKNT